MDIKRALGIGFVLSLLFLLLNAISSKIIGVDLKSVYPAEVPVAMWYTAIILSIILSIIASLWYFQHPKSRPGLKNGFLFGLILITLGFILDIIALVPYPKGWSILLQYYMQPIYWAALAVIVLVCALVGYFRGIKE